jgi:transcriptional regulator GlxA family with amidase domain
MRIGIFLFDQVDLLDAGGPYEVFLTAGRLAERMGEAAPFDVVTVGVTGDTVTAYGGLRLTPHCSVEEAGHLDVLIVPGAIAIDAVAAEPAIRTAVDQLRTHSDLVASVCTGAVLLGDLGLLDGRHWTTHWEDVAYLADRVGSELGRPWEDWVDTGPVVTAGGLSAGISMALHLVDRLMGTKLAVATAHQLQYAWDPEAGIEELDRS